MSMEASDWFKSIGIIAKSEFSLKGKLIFEKDIILHRDVAINECMMLSYSSISPETDILYTSVGRYSSIGQKCKIGFSIHPMDRLTTSALTYENCFEAEGEYHSQNFDTQVKRIMIGHDVWIGAGASILPGLEIGTGSVIAADSVVTKNVEPYSLVAGNPATKKKSRFDDKIIHTLLASEWWRYDLLQAIQKGIVSDWTDPVSTLNRLEDACEKGNIVKIDKIGRSLWREGGAFKCAPMDHKIFA